MRLELIEDWCRKNSINVQRNIPARKLTTFCIGGPLSLLVDVESEEQLSNLLKFLYQESIDYLVLGAGSNLLVNDTGVSKCVLRLGKSFRAIEIISDDTFRIGGAASIMTLSRELSDGGYSGIEFAGGIPGSVGGGIWMNAGAHGGEFSDILTHIRYIAPSGDIISAQSSEIEFSYRHTSIPHKSVILGGEIKLTKDESGTSKSRRAEFLAERKKRQPLSAPSGGSVFKNPGHHLLSAGNLIESVGLKGRAIGEAKVSELHGNWIINPNKKALFSDVVSLIELCKTEVREQRQVELETEIVRW